jgi:hypothetical protein
MLDTKFGTKRQSKMTIKKDGTMIANSFWYEQGSIKACRNASMRLIPKTIVQAVIENAKQKGKVKEVKQEDMGPKQGSGAPYSPLSPSDPRKINFLDEMKKYRVKVGKDGFEEILTGRYSCMKAEEVKPEDQQVILGEMEKAYIERTAKK